MWRCTKWTHRLVLLVTPTLCSTLPCMPLNLTYVGRRPCNTPLEVGPLPTVVPLPVHADIDGVPSGKFTPDLPHSLGTRPSPAASSDSSVPPSLSDGCRIPPIGCPRCDMIGIPFQLSYPCYSAVPLCLKGQ